MMKKLYLILIAISLFSCQSGQETKEKEVEKPKNIILLIGDGMGVTQISAAMTVADDHLNIKKLKYIGLQQTHSASDYITDSGASGTALATGKKTNNYSIGVDTSGNPVKSILEYGEEEGLLTGLISTSAIVHATPAAFIAHQKSRSDYERVALDFLKTDVDVMIGGGSKYFNQREDEINLIDSLKQKGYQVACDLNNIAKDNKKLAVFTAEGHNPPVLEGRGDMLVEATKIALEKLSNTDKGFFLMVEGSQIDWGGHDMDIDYLLSELIDFDKAVGAALEFAENNGETLVIVTADHECGGLSITGGDIEKNTVEVSFAVDHHTPVMVPVFAYGPDAESYQGIYDNTDLFYKMMDSFQIPVK